MQPFNALRAAVSPALVAGLLLTGAASLSAHVVMLQVFGVAFPDRSGVSVWASFLNVALATVALSWLIDIAGPRLTAAPVARWLIVAVLFGALKELLRGQVMNGVVTTAWIFSVAHLIGPILYSLVLSGLLVFVVPRFHGTWSRLGSLLVAAAIMAFAVKPLTGLVLAPLMHSVASLDHPDVYSFPYGLHVLFWAYLTYLEPLAGCVLAAALVLPGLSARPFVRAWQFTGLIGLVKGALLPTVLFGLYNQTGLWAGMLSESQFLFEAVLLALPVALIWPDVRTRAAPLALVAA